MNDDGRRGRDWFEALFAAHHAAVRRYALRRLGPDDADDLVSSVFAVAWRRASAVPDPALPWLYRVAANEVLHARRSRAQAARLTDALAAASGGAASASEPSTGDLDLDGVLAALDETDAELLRLTAWEGLTPSEIAYVLGERPGTVRVRLHRARRRAQALLEARDSVKELT